MGCFSQRTTVKLLGERPKRNYVVAPKALLLDGALTSDARLVGLYLLSVSDGWEVNQRQIAEALGWPTNSRRVGQAIRLLVEHNWLAHNQYKNGNFTYKHEYVMRRSGQVTCRQIDDTYVSSNQRDLLKINTIRDIDDHRIRSSSHGSNLDPWVGSSSFG